MLTDFDAESFLLDGPSFNNTVGRVTMYLNVDVLVFS